MTASGSDRRTTTLNAAAAAARMVAVPALLLALAACNQTQVSRPVRPFRVKDETPPKVVYCNDYTGHLPGTKPFILGGTCCCTPTEALLEAYHRDGFLLDYDVSMLKALYESHGIKTAGDHRDCNNCCPWGPHLIQGGKCMVPPTPGTQHYEEIVTGRFELPEAKPRTQDRRQSP